MLSSFDKRLVRGPDDNALFYNGAFNLSREWNTESRHLKHSPVINHLRSKIPCQKAIHLVCRNNASRLRGILSAAWPTGQIFLLVLSILLHADWLLRWPAKVEGRQHKALRWNLSSCDLGPFLCSPPVCSVGHFAELEITRSTRVGIRSRMDRPSNSACAGPWLLWPLFPPRGQALFTRVLRKYLQPNLQLIW